jgi:hypothetical protein
MCPISECATLHTGLLDPIIVVNSSVEIFSEIPKTKENNFDIEGWSWCLQINHFSVNSFRCSFLCLSLSFIVSDCPLYSLSFCFFLSLSLIFLFYYLFISLSFTLIASLSLCVCVRLSASFTPIVCNPLSHFVHLSLSFKLNIYNSLSSSYFISFSFTPTVYCNSLSLCLIQMYCL